ncbi:LysE family translocator [Catenuloplanes atrovinosus]|uniref:Threonine/homoserine/homoserine lactone efflux protein n=1 Tax=Catenuloplanes atrovinosus TaxID=137266 RepID=A0AAE4CET7_9ACTN|nr:LysE family translocator [Catenuloplanes atrovinosus]MDR7280379.1 threonine/homoserine/homoserine lactone efflux protein [Catenuloplanes atrovinosus]
MHLTVTHLAAFAGVMALGTMSPGPDFAIVLRHAVASGRRAGFATAVGIATGILGWVLLAAVGVAALVATSPVAYLSMKLIGAAYLVFVGLRTLWTAITARRDLAPAAHADLAALAAAFDVPRHRRIRFRWLSLLLWDRRHWAAFRAGLFTNVFNPKVAVFFLALLPQFLPEHPTPGDTLVLGAVSFAVTAGWFTTVTLVVGAMKRLLDRRAVRRGLDTLTGSALLALGLRLAISQ